MKTGVVCQKLLRIIKFVPIVLFETLKGLFEWLVPGSWYAKKVDQDVVLITGGGSGLGRALALEYARLGSSLILWDIDENGLKRSQELVEEQYKKNKKVEGAKDKQCLIYRVDVSNREEVKVFANQVHLDLNKGQESNDQGERYVSVLVNNAGIFHGLFLEELQDDQIERMFKINILAHFWTVRAFLPLMKKHERGHIVEIASMGGICGSHKMTDYCATKFATVGFEESLSFELDHLGFTDKIYTTVVCPYFFSSNLFTGFNTKVTQLMKQEFVAKEVVLGMRCNQTRIMLPKLKCYALYLGRMLTTRKGLAACSKILSIDLSIQNMKGASVV